MAILVDTRTSRTYEAIVELRGKSRKASFESLKVLPRGAETAFAFDETELIAEFTLNDPKVKRRLSNYGNFMNRSHVVADVW
jgi:hypothetical protein